MSPSITQYVSIQANAQESNSTGAPANETATDPDDDVIISANAVDGRAAAIAVGAGALAGLFIYLFWLVVKPRGDERVYDS